ncbi:alpha/beta-hydrolase family protein [Streptomyces sp. TLI_171]|uniref:alpha/beta hydrolase n=1 Tax=Streptomyces sp. TLI_171 TaxID=1938859 RepID=UPI000C4F3548|nr:alpha/beta hydrolase [Streptomyces sp. TLI_171]RKE23219.1 putative membrane protein [Streptomyces sp. TLI_171]
MGEQVDTAGEQETAPRIVRRWPSWSALVGAVVCYCLSFTPSLLPRPWYLQAAAGAITALFGYGFGAFFGFVARECRLLPPDRVRRAGWWLLAVAGGGAVLTVTAWSVRWQGDLRRAVGMDPRIGWWQWALVLPIALLLGALLVLAARAVRLGTRWVRGILGRAVPGWAAAAGAAALATVLVVGFVEGFLLRSLLDLAERGAALTDRSTSPGIVRPTRSTLSGSPDSYESWASLGAKGRDFVGSAPTAAEISAFTGHPAQDPVRAYVGLRSGDGSGFAEGARTSAGLKERAGRAVAELERAGGFERKVLVVLGTTGSGWVNERIAQPVEYLYGGDSAEVAYQYSYLPSWISFLTEGDATDAGRALYDAVRAHWSQLPADHRPRLLVAGESLGSYATERAFPGGVPQLAEQTGGALLVGPTPDNPLRAEVTDHREPGSPVWRPLYQDGQTVRFAQRPGDFAVPAAGWGRPRVVYLQNGTDPVVWWEPTLIWREPAWLNGERAYDVSPTMRWYPLVTFWQVTCDLAASEAVPEGHGHRYGLMPAEAWARIAPPDGWTAQDTDRLVAYLADRLA